MLTMAKNSVDTIDAAMSATALIPQASLFLNFPTELRDEIYGHVASDAPTTSRITFDARRDDNIYDDFHTLLHTCKQTRQEYTRALLRHRGITATIHHFYFDPLMAFLSKLPKSYLHSLPKQIAPLDLAASDANYTTTEAKVHILLKIDDDNNKRAAVNGFRRWMLYQKNLEATNSRLRVSYRFINRPDLHHDLGVQWVYLWQRFEGGAENDITRVETLGMMRCLLKSVVYDDESRETLFTSIFVPGTETEITRTAIMAAGRKNAYGPSSATLEG